MPSSRPFPPPLEDALFALRAGDSGRARAIVDERAAWLAAEYADLLLACNEIGGDELVSAVGDLMEAAILERIEKAAEELCA